MVFSVLIKGTQSHLTVQDKNPDVLFDSSLSFIFHIRINSSSTRSSQKTFHMKYPCLFLLPPLWPKQPCLDFSHSLITASTLNFCIIYSPQSSQILFENYISVYAISFVLQEKSKFLTMAYKFLYYQASLFDLTLNYSSFPPLQPYMCIHSLNKYVLCT